MSLNPSEIETVKVKHGDSFMVINKSEYEKNKSKKKYQLYEEDSKKG